MRAQGMSIRAIAEQVGVSPMQAHRDAESSTVKGLTVEDATSPPSRKEQVLAWLREHGPATDPTIVAAFGGMESIRARRVELTKAGCSAGGRATPCTSRRASRGRRWADDHQAASTEDDA